MPVCLRCLPAAGVTAVISMLPSTEHVADAYEGVSAYSTGDTLFGQYAANRHKKTSSAAVVLTLYSCAVVLSDRLPAKDLSVLAVMC